MNTSQTATDVRYLSRPGGRISYTVTGDGPLIVAVPGMGDLRATWRELVGPLVKPASASRSRICADTATPTRPSPNTAT